MTRDTQQYRKTQRRAPSRLPEYLEQPEVNALIGAVQNPRARLAIMLMWRAGLRVSETIAIEPADLTLDSDRPTIRVRSGKGAKSRIVPMHPTLKEVLTVVLDYSQGARSGKPLLGGVTRLTVWRWVREAAERAEAKGLIRPGLHITPHTFRHSYARHLLMHGTPINRLSLWLGHSRLSTTLIYLSLVPDPSGQMNEIP